MAENKLVTLNVEAYHQEHSNDMKLLFVNPLSFCPIFLHISEQIFEQLDNKSLSNCQEIAKLWRKCIDNKNLSWNQIANVPQILKNEDTFVYCFTNMS